MLTEFLHFCLLCGMIWTSSDADQDSQGNDQQDFQTVNSPQSDDSDPPNSSPTLAQGRQRSRVRQLQNSETDDDMGTQTAEQEPAPTPATPQTQHSRRSRMQQFYRRRPRHPHRHRAEEEDDMHTSILESKMLKVQRLQGKDICVMKGSVGQITEYIGDIHNSLEHMSNMIVEGHRATEDKLDRVATSIEAMCETLQTQQIAHDRRHQRSMSTMQGYTRTINRLCHSTAQLSKSAVAMQMEITHCTADVARGLVQVMNVVEGMQSAGTSGSLLQGGGSDGGSSVSSMLVPVVARAHRSTRNHNSMESSTRDDRSHTGRAFGVRGRKK